MVWRATNAISMGLFPQVTLIWLYLSMFSEEANGVIQRMEGIDTGGNNAPSYADPVFSNIPDEVWDKIEARKNEACKINGKKRGKRKHKD